MTDLTADERAKVEAAARAASTETAGDDVWDTLEPWQQDEYRSMALVILEQLRPHAPKGGEEEMRKQKAIEHAEKYWGPREELEDEEQNNFDAERDAHLAGWDAARAHPPATEARIEKGLIDGVEVDFLIENPPATDARVWRFIERMRELGQAMPPNAVSMEIQKALREFEVKG